MNQPNDTPAPSMPAASSAEIGEALKVLFNALPFQRGTDPATVVMAYVEALRGATLGSIKAGVSKFLRGECEGASPRYVPTPPELARIVRTAIVPGLVPEQRRIAPFRYSSEGERARMRLKMPMFRHAFGSQYLMDQLATANAAGVDAMIILANDWGIAIPEELHGQTNEMWQRARNQALSDIYRDPPPYMRRGRASADERAA